MKANTINKGGLKLFITAVLLLLVQSSAFGVAVTTKFTTTDANPIYNHNGSPNYITEGYLVDIIDSTNNTIDPPNATGYSGTPTGDDVLITTEVIGVGTLTSGEVLKACNITTSHYVYIRVWEGVNRTSATYYGVSTIESVGTGFVYFFPAVKAGKSFSTTTAWNIPSGPDIATCSPARYAGDTSVTMNVVGTNTNFVDGTTTAEVNPSTGVTINSVTASDATHAVINISIASGTSAGSRDITLKTNTEAATGEGLFVITAPSFASVNPTSGYQGDTITGVAIVGTGTHFTGTPTVNFGSNITVSNVVVSDATHLTCDIAILAGATLGVRNVVVTTGSEIVTGTNVFTVNSPSFTSVTPTSGYQGDTITGVAIVGTGTHFGGTTTVSFGTNITVSSIVVSDATHLTCTIAIGNTAAAGARSVSVTTGGETVTGTNVFTVNAPSFTSVTPNSGAQGSTLTGVAIVGTGTHFTGTPTVNFGSNITVSNISVSNATHLTCNIAIQAGAATGARNVVVTTGSETVTGTNVFTVTAASAGSGQLIYEKAGGIMMAYPNPFNPNDKANPLKMLFNTATGEAVDVYVFDTNGRVIYQSRDNQLAADRTALWDGETSYGEVVENGLYLIRIVQDGKLVAKGKILIIKK